MKEHLTLEEMMAGLPYILQSPKNNGIIEMLVIRPEVNQRKEVEAIFIDEAMGPVGDIWKTKRSSSTPDGKPHPEKQITLTNSRCIALLAKEKARWSLAGDQIYVDLDLSRDNFPPGTELQLGTAIVRVSEAPHNGCKKFAERYGKDAMRFVNSEEGKSNQLRGINTKVIKEGVVRIGDQIIKR